MKITVGLKDGVAPFRLKQLKSKVYPDRIKVWLQQQKKNKKKRILKQSLWLLKNSLLFDQSGHLRNGWCTLIHQYWHHLGGFHGTGWSYTVVVHSLHAKLSNKTCPPTASIICLPDSLRCRKSVMATLDTWEPGDDLHIYMLLESRVPWIWQINYYRRINRLIIHSTYWGIDICSGPICHYSIAFMDVTKHVQSWLYSSLHCV